MNKTRKTMQNLFIFFSPFIFLDRVLTHRKEFIPVLERSNGANNASQGGNRKKNHRFAKNRPNIFCNIQKKML
jgi:hypothetical protein